MLQPNALAQQGLQKLPLDVTRWHDLVSEKYNYLFVDKTAKLAALVRNYQAVFIARPRRMGKTLMCSMLYELFAHGTESFKGTAVYDLWPENELFPVIRLSFNTIACDDVSLFEQSLKGALVNTFSQVGFPEVDSFDRGDVLPSFLGKFNQIAEQHELVFLIDEWDYPLSNNLDNEDKFNRLKLVLRDFYAWLRDLPKVRFLLITGIMRYHETSMFTGQYIQDLSMKPYFADLLGYTQQELVDEFAPYIEKAANMLGISTQTLLDKLKRYYDGFCFDYNASVNLYCPYSINQFFDAVVPKAEDDVIEDGPYFDSYWMTSANATAALSSYLRGRGLGQEELRQICNQHFLLSYEDINGVNFFGSVKFKHLLVQAGYFSLKAVVSGKAPTSRKYKCGVTNQEVDEAFVRVLSGYLVNFDDDKRDQLIAEGEEAQKSLLAGDIECMCIRLNQILCKIFSEILKNAPEKLYRAFIARFLSANLITVSEENTNNLGRCDLVATTPNHIYDMELKRLDEDKDADHYKITRLNDGEEQLVERGYGSNLTEKKTRQTGVVLVISDKYRQICAWRTVTQTETGIRRQEGIIPPLSVLTQQQVLTGRVNPQPLPLSPAQTTQP